jgi:hypothetical protein
MGLQTMLASRIDELIRQSRISPASVEASLRTLTPEKVMGLFKTDSGTTTRMPGCTRR